MRCNFTGIDGSKAQKIVSNIGILTSDEVLFAGAKYDYNGETVHYLGSSLFTTMTPYNISDSMNDQVLRLDGWNLNYYDAGGGIRPAIVLKADLELKVN